MSSQGRVKLKGEEQILVSNFDFKLSEHFYAHKWIKSQLRKCFSQNSLKFNRFKDILPRKLKHTWSVLCVQCYCLTKGQKRDQVSSTLGLISSHARNQVSHSMIKLIPCKITHQFLSLSFPYDTMKNLLFRYIVIFLSQLTLIAKSCLFVGTNAVECVCGGGGEGGWIPSVIWTHLHWTDLWAL